jgi:hypothetical protein
MHEPGPLLPVQFQKVSAPRDTWASALMIPPCAAARISGGVATREYDGTEPAPYALKTIRPTGGQTNTAQSCKIVLRRSQPLRVVPQLSIQADA